MTGFLVLATRNPGKVREIRDLMADLKVSLWTLNDFPIPEIPEDAPTLEENALKKARTVAKAIGLPALADDSGLEVDALLGAPGVRSARFAGEGAGDADNCRKLLSLMEGVPPSGRTARFWCVLALVLPEGRTEVVEGICEGRIGEAFQGEKGFGYDPLFIPEGETRTFAELGEEVKNRISHRAVALRKIKPLLFDILKGV